MSLAYPLALWALAGLAVPLLIHLFSQDRGRPLTFAAVRFVRGFKSERLRSPRLTRWLLLVLRCLLLIALAVLMAQPLPRSETRLGGPVAVLVSPLALAAGGERTVTLGRQLAARNGTEARLLAPGFPQIDLLPEVNGGAWSLLAELEENIDTGTSILLLIADDPRETLVRKPLFSHRVESSVVSGPAPDFSSGPLRVGLFTSSERRADLEYVGAALRTLEHSGLAMVQENLDSLGSASEFEVLMVLDRDQCPRPVAGQLVICDGGELPFQPNSGNRAILDFSGQAFDLQLSADPTINGETLHASRSGQAIATLARVGQGALIRFNSRFNPEYASVVASHHFPGLVRELIRDNTLPPVRQEARTRTPDRYWWPGVVVLLLWLLERLLSVNPGPLKAGNGRRAV